MEVEVFDDFKSIIHVIAGGICYLIPLLFIIFAFYEFIEFLYKREKTEHYCGDILEFCLGYTALGLCLSLIS